MSQKRDMGHPFTLIGSDVGHPPMRFADLSPELQRVLAPKKSRGAQKAPTKELISIRLSRDVLEALRSRGPGWQAFADETLRKQLVKAR